VFESGVLRKISGRKRNEGNRGVEWSGLHDEKLYDLCCSTVVKNKTENGNTKILN